MRKGWYANGCPRDGTQFRVCQLTDNFKRVGMKMWNGALEEWSVAHFEGDVFIPNASGWKLSDFSPIDE